MKSEKEIAEIIIQQTNIAVVGASRYKKKFGYIIYKYLKMRGYNVVPVNPNADQIEGDKCYTDVASLHSDVTAIVMVTQPKITDEILARASAKGIELAWLQPGSASNQTASIADNLGLKIVIDKCIMTY